MSPDVHQAIVDRMPDRARLTLRGLLRGLSEKEVAAELSMSLHTVHGHVKDIYRLLGVHSRAELLVALLAPHVPAVLEARVVDDRDGVDERADASSIHRGTNERGSDGQANSTTPRSHAR